VTPTACKAFVIIRDANGMQSNPYIKFFALLIQEQIYIEKTDLKISGLWDFA